MTAVAAIKDRVPKPSTLWVPPGAAGNYRAEIADIMEMVGRPLDNSQLDIAGAMTSYRPDGRWLTLETGIIMPRRNGKTAGVVLGIVLLDLLIMPPGRVAWTAHRLMTVKEDFDNLKLLIAGSSELSRHVKKITESHTSEGVSFTTGSSVRFMARTDVSARGLGGKRVVVDEALVFTTGQAGALLPILATEPLAQVIYASSAAKVTSGHLHDLVRRGRARNDNSLIFAEYRARGTLSSIRDKCRDGKKCDHTYGTKGCQLDNEDLWRESNPAVYYGRIPIEFLRAMRKALKANEFAREFLSWEESQESSELRITPDQWSGRASGTSAITGKFALALDVSPNGSTASIASAGLREDGDIHLSLIESAPGSAWTIRRLAEIKKLRRPIALVVDGASPAASLIPQLRRVGFKEPTADGLDGLLKITGAADMGRACTALKAGIAGDNPNVWHRGDPIVDDAIAGAVSRPIGDGLWAWGRKKSDDADVDITPLVAMTLAHWGFDNAR